jgi:predicted chitinase
MENQDFLQIGAVNSFLPILGQQQGNFFSSDLIQPYGTNLSQSGSFSDQMEARIADVEIKEVEYDQYLHESVFGKSPSELVALPTNSESITSSERADFLIGNVTSVNSEAVLDSAFATAKEQLESFVSDEEFLDQMNLALGDDWSPQAADALIQELASGEAMPKIEILPAANLKANGAFGEGTIYLSEKFLTENTANPEAVAGVLLEEIGHYVDQELNSVDSSGDEGNIFVKLVQGETISGAELTALKAEDDSATIALNGQEIAVELADPPYPGYLLKYEPGETLTYDENVQQWQQRMKDLGKTIDVDGLYGPQSAQVARDFQQEQGLGVDGIVGPQTWEASFDTDDVTLPPPPDEVIRIANEEWEFFDRGTLKETEEGAWQHIASEYWQTQDVERTDIDTPAEVGSDNNPWSAAFISWVMQEAGAGDQFNYSQLHADYINQAIEDRESEAAFIGHPIDAYSLQPGDLIGANRPDENGPNGSDVIVTYDTAVDTGGYSSHVDIVVATRPDEGEIDVIGGNVDNSVTLETYTIDSEGKIINPDDGDGSDDFFVVIENRLGENDPPPTGSTPYNATEIINSSAVEPEIREYAETSVPLILSEAEESGVTDPGQIAYILASADHESLLGRYLEELASGEEYEGSEELGNTELGDGPRFKGRGYVQITGRTNYTNWSERLGVDLVGNPEVAADPDIAATILVQGMRDGSFTDVGLSDYISGENRDFVNARRIVNGLDKAEEIAQDAERYYQVLTT